VKETTRRTGSSSPRTKTRNGRVEDARVPPRLNRVARWIGISFILTIGTLLVFAALDVRLGQGYFAYRYSPLRGARTMRAAAALPVMLLAAGSVWALVMRKRWGPLTLAAALIAGTLWVWWAPPAQIRQHAFNLRSVSSDGAFVLEAEFTPNMTEYLRHFDRRLARTPAEMMGTRVLSNPPGTTALAYAVIHAFPTQVDPPGALERYLLRTTDVEPEGLAIIVNSLHTAMALLLLWSLAAVVAYFLGRLYLSPAGAAFFAIVATWNPSTVHFVPGKDPAQLLTINLMLLCWLGGWKRRSMLLSTLAGSLLVVGVTIGLIHIWVALAVFAATAWEARAERSIKLLLQNALAAAVGALVVLLLALQAMGWNIAGQTLAVAQRFSELQETFNMSRAVWFVIGLPIFLLFLPLGFWALAGLRVDRRRLGFGGRIAVCTLAVMLVTYLMGVTYELPRLWVAFLPPLTLGLAIDLPMLRSATPSRRVARFLAATVAIHVVATALHWTIFDVREAEYRLITQRLYN
jgi:hypothetical protein